MEEKLRKTKVKKTVQIDPLDITESLGYKTHRKNGRNSWSKEEDEELKAIMDTVFVGLGYKNGIADIKSIQESGIACGKVSWENIALRFKNSIRKPKDLRKRWTSSLDPNLKKGKWASEEDNLLMKAYEKHGPHWLSVAEEISGRTEDQCAKRYIEILGPSSEGRLRKWTLEEDLSLVSKVKLYGTRWRRISSEMESRPSLTCRNRWRKIITSVVRGRAPLDIVKAVKEKQDLDLLNESLGVKAEISVSGRGSTSDLTAVQDRNNLSYDHGSSNILRPKLQNALSRISLSHSEEEDTDYGKSNNSALSFPNLDNAYGSNTFSIPQLQAVHGRQRKVSVIEQAYDKEGLSSTRVNTEFTPKSVEDSVEKAPLPSVKNSTSLPTKSTSLEESLFGDRLNARSIDNRHVGELPNSRVDARQDTEKISLPHAGQMEWKFTLKDGQGLSLSSGTVANSGLVKELIDQARKYSLKISIHQHIHNHYGQQTDSQPLHSNFPENLNSLRASNIISPLSHPNPDLFNSASEYRAAFNVADHPTDNDFLSQTPTYNVFGLEPSPPPDNTHLTSSTEFFPKNQSHSMSVSVNQSPQNYHVKTGTSSSTGSHSTPGDEVQDVVRNRVSHFNYLPPTVKPQLGSSDSTKATDLSKLLNPSPGNSTVAKRGKRHRKNAQLEGGHRPLSHHSSTNTSPSECSNKQSKPKHDTPTTTSSINDEEGLDFWESLRSLAGGPSPEEDTANANQHDEEDYHLFYGLFNNKIGHSDLATEKPDVYSGKGKDTVLPFNPS